MTDFKHTDAGDIDLTSGDIAYAESTEQHMKDILLARKGDYRTTPATGVGLPDFLDDERPDDLYAEMRRQLAADGLKVTRLGVVNGEIKIEASYA